MAILVNSLWHWWSCFVVYCPGGNVTDPIWRVLASSDGISSWTSLKPKHSNPKANPLANQLWCIDLLTPPTPHIIPHRLPAFLESLMPLKNWWSIHARSSKSSVKHSLRFCDIFPSLKQNFVAYRSSKVSPRPDCIFEIHQLWQSGFSRVHSNSFESEIINISQSSHKMYSNNILNVQESTTVLNACTKKGWKRIEGNTYIRLIQWRDITSLFHPDDLRLQETYIIIRYAEREAIVYKNNNTKQQWLCRWSWLNNVYICILIGY